MADIFVSYARADRDRVRPLVEALRAEGFSVWWDEGLSSGEAWRAEIRRELAAARVVLVAWSHDSVDSRAVHSEADHAERRGALRPVLIDDVEELPLFLDQIQAENLVGWRGDRGAAPFRRLAAQLALKIRPEDPSVDPALRAWAERITNIEALQWGYARRINGFLDWLEMRLDSGPLEWAFVDGRSELGRRPERPLLSRCFTPALLSLTLLLAVAYPLFSASVQWLITGEEGRVGAFVVVAAEPDFWGPRALVLVFFVAVAASRLYFFSGSSFDLISLTMVLAFAVYLSLDGRFISTILLVLFLMIAFWTVKLWRIEQQSLIATTIALAVALVASLMGELSLFRGAMAAIAVGAMITLAQFIFSRRRSVPAILFILFAYALVLYGSISGASWLHWDGVLDLSQDRANIVVFLAVLPLANAMFDFCSIGLTRCLLRLGGRRTGIETLGFAALDLALGALIFVALGCASIAALHALRDGDGKALLDLPAVFADIAARPHAYWWLYATYFSTLLPTVLHAMIASAAFFDIFVTGAAAAARRALATSDPAEMDRAILAAGARIKLAQALGVVAGVAVSAGLIYLLTIGGAQSIAWNMFLFFVWFAKAIGALAPEFQAVV